MRLEVRWPEKARLMKLWYFAGMSIPEAAKALEISRATAERPELRRGPRPALSPRRKTAAEFWQEYDGKP